jgi:hypothetical protein
MNISLLSLPIPYHPAMDSLDSTKIQAYQSCPRRFFFEYLLGWRSARPSNHLIFGKCVHKALEHLYTKGFSRSIILEAMDIFYDLYRIDFPEESDQFFYPKTPATFFNMLSGYVQTYADDFTLYKIIKTEFGGTIILDDPFYKLSFKMDTILQRLDNSMYLSFEHKTKGGNYIDKNYDIQHLMSIQCGTYNHVLNCLYPPSQVEGIVINVMCFKKTKSPDYILQRHPLLMSLNYMWMWMQNTKTWMDKIWADFQLLSTESDKSELMLSFCKNGRSCTSFGATCPYINYCLNIPNPLQQLNNIPIDFKVDFWDPLTEDLTEKVEL